MSLQVKIQSKAENVLESEATFYGVSPTALARAIIDRVATGGILREVLQGVDVVSYHTRARGRPKAVMVEFRGQKRSIGEISRMTGVNESTLRMRVFTYEWPIERAVTQPIKGRTQ